MGPTGRAVGLDMTASMLERSRRLAEQNHYDNVEFVEGIIEKVCITVVCNYYRCHWSQSSSIAS